MEERTFIDGHGVEVFTRWWPIDAPKGVVLVAHGASEHSGRYDRFAQALNGAGYAVAALDHRGHGRTAGGEHKAMMGPGGGQAVVDDLHELPAQAAERFGADVPVLLFGHSMGALVGLAYLTQESDGLAGAVLCGMAADVNGVAALGELLQGMADAGLRDEPAADLLAANNDGFQPARTPFDWLSRDPAEVDMYLADAFCGDQHPLTFGYLLDLFEVVAPAAERLGEISCPVLVIAGDQDPAAAMGANATALASGIAAAGGQAELRLYQDARHELLNETNRDEVTADVIAWIDARV